MRKLLLALLVSLCTMYANVVNGVAIVVNDDPITLYDIAKKQAELKTTKDKAVAELIDQTLFDQLVKKYNITADIYDVDNYLEKVAASNGMDLYTFKSVVKQKYQDNYDKYIEQTEELIIRQKLTDKLVRGNIKIATEEDLKIYYENNPNMFKIANNIKAVQYSSPKRSDLVAITNNPMINLPEVVRTPIDLDQSSLNPQLRYIINETKINQFTPIFTSDNKYVTLMITQKDNVQTIDFKDVRDRIFNIVMQSREQKYLKDYFEKLKLSANIQIIR